MRPHAEFRERPSRVFQVLFIIALAFPILRGSRAQSSTDAKGDTPSSLLLAAQSALIGTAKSAQDVRLIGMVEYIAGSQKESGSVAFLSRPDGTAKTTMVLPSGEHRSLRSPLGGGSGNATKNLDGVLQPITSHNLLTAASWFFPEHLLAELSEPGRRTTSVSGQSCPSGQVCFTSQIGLSDQTTTAFMRKMSSMTVDLDQNTLLPKQLDFNIRSNANRLNESVLLQVTYDDYRVVEGHEIPFHVRQYVNGSLHLDITLSTVELNASIAASDLTIQ